MVIDSDEVSSGDPRRALVTLYDESVGDVYRYVAARCGSATIAEDLTAETFLAAAAAVRNAGDHELDTAWLIGVARHKLVDHWRRAEREQRTLSAVDSHAAVDDGDDTWDVALDVLTTRRVLATLAAQHRSALVLRYVDGLPVRSVAEYLGRTEGAAEVLLVRARSAFRSAYEASEQESAT
ncbi:MAG TPA: RNA polymerase sigma factor [Ilumatobacter sp.]|nr:RNA polymerase sigma factor [Ilumatobacter sp.]